jgi:hypothetical protein
MASHPIHPKAASDLNDGQMMVMMMNWLRHASDEDDDDQ